MDNLLQQNTEAEINKDIPAKFLDKDNNVRTDALLKSYLELEKKLAQSAKPDLNKIDRNELNNLIGVPASPKDYAIKIDHTMFTEDDEINKRLHDKGFSVEQAQFLYDLAAEYMVPMVLDIAREFEAERQLDKLIDTFGSRERYQEVARQLQAYGQKNLPKEVLEGLSSSFEGVMALYRMMQSNKPMALQAPTAQADVSESELKQMMRDPKYWRDRDQAFIKKVSDGFRQVFAEQQ